MFNTTRWGFASAVKQPLRLSTASRCFRPVCSASRSRPRQLPPISQSLERTFATSIRLTQSLSQATAQRDETHGDSSLSENNSSNAQSQSQNNGPITKFRELGERGLVHPKIVENLTGPMGLETMTEVQSLTIGESLKGVDILAQARTGTGKTLAFLIPLVQNILNHEPHLLERNRRDPPRSDGARALIVSPTRELAEQIATAAKALVAGTNMRVQCAVGGTQKRLGLRMIQDQGCHILVGTPGRLIDILSDPASGVRLPRLNTWVLDEADRLLDDGFYPDIKEIREHLPRLDEVDRQTLLYSATVPTAVRGMVQETLKPNYKMVKTVKEGELATHQRVPQKVVRVRAFQNALPALVELCTKASLQSAEKPFKAIVFYSATAEAILAYDIFDKLRGTMSSDSPFSHMRIIQMHAKLSQDQRTRAADGFRRATNAIMFSSDVTARGMDFPNVTHVIQVGLPPTEEQYVHRLGRTARADKSGEGWIILAPHELREGRSRLRAMPLSVDESLETATVDMTQQGQMSAPVAKILTEVGDACRRVAYGVKAAAYKAELGIMSYVRDKQDVIDTLNERALYGWGMETPPKIAPRLASKLGLSSLRGIELGIEEREFDRGYGSQLRRPRFDSDFGNSDDYGQRTRRPPPFDNGFDRDRYSPRSQRPPRFESGYDRGLNIRREDQGERRPDYGRRRDSSSYSARQSDRW